MEWNLAELRCLVAAERTGTFTDAAIELGISQAAVSRRIAALEKAVGERLVRRAPRGCSITGVGEKLLPQFRRVLAEADRLTEQLTTHHSTLRLGYTWAALGEHTASLLRTWDQDRADIELQLTHYSSPTAGLAEGRCDAAIVRVLPDTAEFESVVVGLEQRLAVFATDDTAWERRRRLSLHEIAERQVIIDPRAGTTDEQLWIGRDRMPRFIERDGVDTWLDEIAAGRGVGITSEATAVHHARAGVCFRPIKDAPHIPVRLAWRRDQPPVGLGQLLSDITELYQEKSNPISSRRILRLERD